MTGFLDRHYFMLKRLNSILGIVPVGAFFFMHMFLNSRTSQGPSQYQWVPDTLDQIPFLLFVEVFVILVPILIHGVLGLWISSRADYAAPRPARRWYSNVAFMLQRITGIALFFLIIIHVIQTWWQHQSIKLAAARTGNVHAAEYDIYGSMHEIMQNPVWLAIYIIFVLMAAWHFGNGIYNVCFKFGVTTSTASQRWALGLGLAIGLVCFGLGMASLWGLTLSEWARSWAHSAVEMAGR
jgi:succinate dehydrogenase / fumarate reductase, cytochrome b subunit